MQTSGNSCRENADLHLLFQIEPEMHPRLCERSEAIHFTTGTAVRWIASLRSQ